MGFRELVSWSDGAECPKGIYEVSAVLEAPRDARGIGAFPLDYECFEQASFRGCCNIGTTRLIIQTLSYYGPNSYDLVHKSQIDLLDLPFFDKLRMYI